MKRVPFHSAVLVSSLILFIAAAGDAAALSDSLRDELRAAKYVYISSTRKDGSLSNPAEIWFFERDGAVYVGTPPTSWRVKRIKAGRSGAKIWIGKPDGSSMYNASESDLKGLSSFEATGSIVDDPKLREKMFEAFAKKYPEGWPQHEESFRTGFKNGNRVMVKYVPK